MSKIFPKEVFFCKTCLVMSTRPRITFDKNGNCSACQWNKEKKKLDWKLRKKKLSKLCKKFKKKGKVFDCIVAVSGGKDGSYVAHELKKKYGMNPLTVTVRPAMETELGRNNLGEFVKSDFNNILISPDQEGLRKLNLYGLKEIGFPYYGWLIAIHSIVLKIACMFKISLIFYSEDGEVEYGGDAKFKNNGIYGTEYIKKNYLEAGYETVLKKAKLNHKEAFWFKLPEEKELNKNNITLTHYSFYENWDPYRNYLIAKKYCGLTENKTLNEGSYTNFAQNDQKLYALHVYLMYLKFGFGRCNQDSSIDIRRGSMSRDQAIELVKLYDGIAPKELYSEYCSYYKISKKTFLDYVNKWVNKDLFKKNSNGKWEKKFQIQ